MEYVYPAVFHENGDGSFTVLYPDLPGCVSEGKDLLNAMYMAEAALKQWIGYLLDKNEPAPVASSFKEVKAGAGEFVNFVRVQVRDSRAVKRTVSLPKWMDDKAAKAGLSLSRVLQDAIGEKLGTN
jgi:predicted RNase H-like HicB family nuclease